MHSTGQGYPQKKVKNKDDTHSTRKNYVFMTDYGTSDKITYGNIVYKLKKMCLYDTTMTYVMRHLINYNYAAGSVVDRTVIVGEIFAKSGYRT